MTGDPYRKKAQDDRGLRSSSSLPVRRGLTKFECTHKKFQNDVLEMKSA
jgi:hypothetical protein